MYEQHLSGRVKCMSRGWGKVQRHVVATLTEAAERREDAWVLLRSLAGQDPAWDDNGKPVKVSTSRAEATRRAVRRLVAEGVVEKRTTRLGTKTLAVVRLRRKEPDEPPILPKSMDQMLNADLHRQNLVHNELLQALGSRYRRQLVARLDTETARLYVPDDPQGTYQTIYLNQPAPPNEHEWFAEYATLFSRPGKEAGSAVGREIEIQVEAAIAHRGAARCDSCRAAQREQCEAFTRPVKTMTDRELQLEMSALLGWDARKLLDSAWRELSALPAEQDETWVAVATGAPVTGVPGSSPSKANRCLDS